MGVKYLWGVIEPTCQEKSVAELYSKKVAIDLACWVVTDNQVLPAHIAKPHLRQLFFRTAALLDHGIEPVYVLEGQAPELKAQTMARRRELQWGSSQIQSQAPSQSTQTNKTERSRYKHIQAECVVLLDCLGVASVTSKGEAEAGCASLNFIGAVDGCITKDGDTFLYGAHTVLRNLSTDPTHFTYHEYRMDRLESRLNLSRDRLIAMAILLGCDYLPDGVPGVRKDVALRILSQLPEGRAIEELDSWLVDGDPDAADNRQEEPVAPPRPPHCRQCKHPGSVREHTKSGCRMCPAGSNGCQESNDACTCAWHNDEAMWEGRAVRAKLGRMDAKLIRRIVDEFLSGAEKAVPASTAPRWRMPDVHRFVELAVKKLKWEASYAAQKILPVLARWFMTHCRRQPTAAGASGDAPIAPIRTLKKRVRRGCPVFEVEWRFRQSVETFQHFPDVFTTHEPLFLLQEHFPDLLPAPPPPKPPKRTAGRGRGKASKAAAPSAAPTSVSPASEEAPSDVAEDGRVTAMFQKMSLQNVPEDNTDPLDLLGPDDLDLSGGSDDSDLSFIVQMICDRKTTMSKTKPVLQDLLDPAVRQTAPNVPDIPTAPTVPANSCPVGNFSLNFSLGQLDASGRLSSHRMPSIAPKMTPEEVEPSVDEVLHESNHQTQVDQLERQGAVPLPVDSPNRSTPLPFLEELERENSFSTPLPLARHFERMAL